MITDEYNHYMGVVNEFDYLTTQNSGLRPIRRGGSQALEHWLLQTILVNYYLLVLYSDVPEPRQVSFRSQQDFRKQLVSLLLAMGRDSEVYKKRRIGIISQEAIQAPEGSHEQVKMAKRGIYINYRGFRFRDRPKKRVALAEIVANKGRESTFHLSCFGYKQCDVNLYRNRGCFDVFHK